jgi:NAD(P)-dependent dehydrogenase (short-subunit alcohol dehydrogenase family)
MNLDFNGRTAVVTGAARGIGASIAEALHARGANVVLADVLSEVAETAEKLGERAHAATLDVTDAAAAKDFVGSVVKEHGSLDILVNNAGITRDQLLPRMKAEEFDLVMKVNLYGTFHMTQAAARPMMKARGGRIVNVASVIGLHGNIGQANGDGAGTGAPRRHGQRHRPGLHPDPHDGRPAGERQGPDAQRDPVLPLRRAGRRHGRRSVPRVGPLRLRDGAGHRGRRGDVHLKSLRPPHFRGPGGRVR